MFRVVTFTFLILSLVCTGCGTSKTINPTSSNENEVVSTTPPHLTESSPTPAPTATDSADMPGINGFMYRDNETLGFIKWTDKDGQWIGSLQLTYIDSSGKDSKTYSIKSSNLGFKGIANGSDITLTFDLSADSFLAGKTVSGVFKEGTLSLLINSSNGTINTVTFTKSDTESYNAAVEQLTTKLATFQKDQQQKADQKKLENDQNAVAQTLKDVQLNLVDTYELLGKTELDMFNNKFDSINLDINKVYQEIKNTADGKTLSLSEISDLRSRVADMRELESQARLVGTDLLSETLTIENTIDQCRSLIKKLQQNWNTANQLEAYTGFSQNDIDGLVQEANSQIKFATGKENEANSYEEKMMKKMDQTIDSADYFVENIPSSD